MLPFVSSWTLSAAVLLFTGTPFQTHPEATAVATPPHAAAIAVGPGTTPSHAPAARTAGDVSIVFDLTAEFREEPNGDVYLDFGAICEMVWNAEAGRDECTYPSRYIHYSRETNLTTGRGYLFGEGDDGSVWTIDLGQIRWVGEEALLYADFGSLIAEEVGGQERVRRASGEGSLAD